MLHVFLLPKKDTLPTVALCVHEWNNAFNRGNGVIYNCGKFPMLALFIMLSLNDRCFVRVNKTRLCLCNALLQNLNSK